MVLESNVWRYLFHSIDHRLPDSAKAKLLKLTEINVTVNSNVGGMVGWYNLEQKDKKTD